MIQIGVSLLRVTLHNQELVFGGVCRAYGARAPGPAMESARSELMSGRI
jgi:hypothetical protein